MKKTLGFFGILAVLSIACSSIAPSAPQSVETDVSPQPVIEQPADGQAAAQNTLLYVSGTIHIETNRKTWPDPDALLAFFEDVTALGMRWSISADIGWLEGEPRAAEVIQKSEALGIEWDVHVHRAQDRGQVAYLIRQYGGHPTSVYSGFRMEEFENIIQPASYQGYTWQPGVLWGAVFCPGHGPGCDNDAVGLWYPLSGAEYQTHNPNGQYVHVGGGAHGLDDARTLTQEIAAGTYNYPVISYTIMVQPTSLENFTTGEGIDEIRAFVQEMQAYPFVRWATIEETAQAWVAAGSVPSQIQLP
ncbi:MAG: hypothetical protein Kow002_05540 [Anaerolineales bacterium]